ncbi:branched-chain amino acid:cation transporter, LIVCS family [Granulicatella balaenopterae]|uniref:Branched-chain amino acid transport system carrier protein n=1 Tax=Granulicatella balaenopterae TaxID=137733 RepID=A0A1H9NGQ2_9LACT|nr:branched-chain amino acid transport system II carrier protein [Granulicatella balaenopterae]SER34845.1 branched-chain amino acid:cation transporter, LIVCS family [Granulicatella balaenopterae]
MKKGFLTGLLLFGIFFGAGNLIFPPALGMLSGNEFSKAILGFVLSEGIAIATLVVGTFNNGGYKAEMDEKFSPRIANIFLVALYLTIGPFFAIPRTAAVSYSMGIAPIFGESHWGLLIFTGLYFLAAYLLAMNPSKIMDRVGKLLTPVFVGLILLIVILGSVKFNGTSPLIFADTYPATKAFSQGFIEGYNTLDAIASVAFSIIAIDTLKGFNFKTKKEYISTIWIVGIFTAFAFSLLYFGLAYLGHKFPVPLEVATDPTINKGVYILTETARSLFGDFGMIVLGAMVTLTCFTSTVGLIVATAEFFNKNFQSEKYSYYNNYKMYATVFTIIGLVISNAGLASVINYSLPVLQLLYPLTITIMLIIIVNKWIPLSKQGMTTTFIVVFVIALLSITGFVLGENHALTIKVNQLLSYLPLAKDSLGWLVPCLFGMAVSSVLPNRQLGTPFELDA